MDKSMCHRLFLMYLRGIWTGNHDGPVHPFSLGVRESCIHNNIYRVSDILLTSWHQKIFNNYPKSFAIHAITTARIHVFAVL